MLEAFRPIYFYHSCPNLGYLSFAERRVCQIIRTRAWTNLENKVIQQSYKRLQIFNDLDLTQGP